MKIFLTVLKSCLAIKIAHTSANRYIESRRNHPIIRTILIRIIGAIVYLLSILVILLSIFTFFSGTETDQTTSSHVKMPNSSGTDSFEWKLAAKGNIIDVPLTFFAFTSGHPMPQIIQIIL